MFLGLLVIMPLLCDCRRSWRQWCVLCQKEFLAGFYIQSLTNGTKEIRQWLYCPCCNLVQPPLRDYEECAAQLVTETLEETRSY